METTRDDYLRRAKDARDLSQIGDPAVQAAFVSLARKWERLAAHEPIVNQADWSSRRMG
jgi:hypothetical protein